MGKHTPGPWSIIPEKLVQGQHAAGRGPRIVAGERPVASVARLGQKPKDAEAEANAALIAAAPELLAALHGMDVLYAEMQAAMPGLVGTKAYDIVTDAVRAARAAIAKAEGQP